MRTVACVSCQMSPTVIGVVRLCWYGDTCQSCSRSISCNTAASFGAAAASSSSLMSYCSKLTAVRHLSVLCAETSHMSAASRIESYIAMDVRSASMQPVCVLVSTLSTVNHHFRAWPHGSFLSILYRSHPYCPCLSDEHIRHARLFLHLLADSLHRSISDCLNLVYPLKAQHALALCLGVCLGDAGTAGLPPALLLGTGLSSSASLPISASSMCCRTCGSGLHSSNHGSHISCSPIMWPSADWRMTWSATNSARTFRSRGFLSALSH